MSLNKALITGPDLLQNLVGVLLRFREERVALVADVEQMFHRIQVREEDQPALSFFLWRDLDRRKPPDIYQVSNEGCDLRCEVQSFTGKLHPSENSRGPHVWL